MSRSYDVRVALKALIVAAAPNADVLGIDKEAARPRRTAPGGLIILEAGDPGDPEVDLNPLTYWYTHPFPVSMTIAGSDGQRDELLGAIGAAIVADRTLGGLCDWLEAEAPLLEDISGDGTPVAKGASFNVVASYHTQDPLN